MTDKKDQKQQEPTPATVVVAGVVIKRDDAPRYIYNPVRPLG
jgi:hypothetical protein